MCALKQAACLMEDASTTTVTVLLKTKLNRHCTSLKVTALAWAQKDGPVSSVLVASQTGSMDFGADALE